MAQSKYTFHEFSGALQQKSTTHIKKPNEVRRSVNVDFWTTLGAMRRRKGAQGDATDYELPKLPIDTPALGAFVARFPTSIEVWAAQDDAATSPTEATLAYWTGPDPTDWTEIENGITAGSEVNMVDDLDEVWVSSYDPILDAIGDPFTVDSAHDVSTTRHLQFAPKARFYIEFNGAMWALNCLVDGVRYRDRAYKSSGPTGAFAFARSAQSLTQLAATPTVATSPLEVDSVRYLKAGSVVDIYQAGTETLLYTLTVASVDKALDTVVFNALDTLTFAASAITTATDIITVPSSTWTVTGLPVTFWQGTGLPAGLAQGTIYYIIRVSATEIKLATSRANALAGTAVNITTQGTGTHRITFTPVFGNKDEFWKSGRKGKLTRFWNTDYRNPEAADWIKLPPTFDALNDITAVGKISNRLFMFTENAMVRFDGQNRVPLRNDVGCIAHKSIGYYDTFMVWLDAKSNIWIRNEEAGEQDIISEGIEKTMKLVPQSQLPEATAVCSNGIYKLYLGYIASEGKHLRVVYNFRTNQWTEEWWTPKMVQQFEYTYEGTAHPHFFDEVGQLWVDEEGDDDNGTTIHFAPETGNDNFGVDELKKFYGIKVYSDNAAATKVFVSIDDGEWKDVGQITKPVDSIALNGLPAGTLFNLRFVNSASGDAPQIEKAVVWYSREEDTFRASK